MALDEAILTLVGDGSAPPTLRFYAWDVPWLSLGSGQSAADLDLAAVRERGWGTVRRASGGSAVLHAGQLGYALVLPAGHDLWQGDLTTSYRRLSEPLRRGFAKLGALLEVADPGANASFTRDAPSLASRACFGALGPYELVDGGRKVVGNSQIRRRASASQHGVIQLTGDQRDLAGVIAAPSHAERQALAGYLAARVSSVEASAARPVGGTAVVGALVAAFAEVLDVTFVVDDLSQAERGLAAELVATKYGCAAWTFRR